MKSMARHALDLFAHPHALAAQDALGRITDDGGAGDVVPRSGGGSARVRHAGAPVAPRPASAARSCRCGRSYRQSSGWLASSSSTIVLRASMPAGECVWTFMPRPPGKAQDGIERRACPSTSTTHMRQAPAGDRPPCGTAWASSSPARRRPRQQHLAGLRLDRSCLLIVRCDHRMYLLWAAQLTLTASNLAHVHAGAAARCTCRPRCSARFFIVPHDRRRRGISSRTACSPCIRRRRSCR